MSRSPVVHRLAAHEWRTYRELRLRALAESPDAFGSTLEAESGRPDAEWARRLEIGASAARELPLVARLGDEAIGIAWGRAQQGAPDVAHLFQVWVAPEHRGCGAGRMLLEAAVTWARTIGAQHLALDVTCGDTAAVRLYARAGFRAVGDPEPLRPGSPVMVQPMRLPLGAETSAQSA